MTRTLCLILSLALLLTGCLALTERDVDPHQLADPNSRFITIDGVELHYLDEGQPEAPAVVLVHGFAASTFSWRHTIPALVEAGYRVVALDRAGFGLSEKSASIDYRHAAQADRLAGLLDALDIQTATLVGHSQGGNVVAHFALRHPQRLDKLVIVAGAVVRPGGLSALDTNPIGLALNPPAVFRNLMADDDVRRLFAFALGVYFDRERVAELVASAYGPDAEITSELVEGYYRALRTPGWEQGLIAMTLDTTGNTLSQAQLGSIQAETLLIWGAADTWVPLRAGQRLANRLPNARLIVYPQVGHSPMDTISDQFNADLLGFLAGAADG